MIFHGSMVALITPMGEDGAIDDAALKKLVEWHIVAGTQAIIAVGTTGESATLDEAEHCDVIGRVVELSAGRVPIIAGTGANSTSEAIALTRCAKSHGADAALLVTPYYNKPTQEGLYLHHKAIAEAVDLPQILYNVPGRTACDMQPETVARLAQVDNIVGIKEATGDLGRLAQIKRGCGDEFGLYSGDDATGCEFICQGGHGVISVTSNIAPAEMQRMCRLALDGDHEGALAINRGLDELHHVLFVESNPIPVKWALHEMGMAPKGIRLPLTWLAPAMQPKVRQALIQAGLISG